MGRQPGEVLGAIESAFANTIYPGDDRIADFQCGDWETEEVRAALKGQKWGDLSKATLEEVRQGVFFLSAEGFRYYLPAFMSFCITDSLAADVLPQSLISELSPPRWEDLERLRQGAKRLPDPDYLDDHFEETARYYRDGTYQREFEERVTGLTREQRQAIRAFLQYMLETHAEDLWGRGANEALERYWNQF